LVSRFEGENDGEVSFLIKIYPIWVNFKVDMLWLDYRIRFYRNRFIVHSERPWQRGKSASLYGDKFSLWIPTPLGWLDDERIDREINELLHLAPKHIRKASNDYWEKARPRALIERIFDNIGQIEDRGDREKVYKLFGKAGGSTPSFQIVAERLFKFISSATEQLDVIVGANLKSVDGGSKVVSEKS